MIDGVCVGVYACVCASMGVRVLLHSKNHSEKFIAPRVCNLFTFSWFAIVGSDWNNVKKNIVNKDVLKYSYSEYSVSC